MDFFDLKDFRQAKGWTLREAAECFSYKTANYAASEKRFPAGKISRISGLIDKMRTGKSCFFVVPCSAEPGYLVGGLPPATWDNLTRYRIALRLTLRDADTLLGLAPGSSQQIERNWPNVTTATAVKVAEGYGVDLWFPFPGVGRIDDPLVPNRKA